MIKVIQRYMKNIIKIAVLAVFFMTVADGCGVIKFKESAFGSSEEGGVNANYLKVDTAEAMRYANVYEFMSNRFVGVDVRRSGPGEYSIRVRGINSITGSLDPVLIVDGVPSRDLLGVNMADLDTIEIVKGPKAAKYDVDGAVKGVIIVTTKR